MSQMASGGRGGLSPMRMTRKAPSCTHSKETCPFAVSDGPGRKDAFASSIFQSPTNTSRCLSAGLCGCELVILFILFREALSKLSLVCGQFLLDSGVYVG